MVNLDCMSCIQAPVLETERPVNLSLVTVNPVIVLPNSHLTKNGLTVERNAFLENNCRVLRS